MDGGAMAQTLPRTEGDVPYGGVDPTALLTPTTLLVLAGLVLLLLLLAGIAAGVAYRKIRRNPRLADTALAVRAQLHPEGAVRRLLELRVRLRQAIAAARECVRTTDGQGQDMGELARLAARVTELGQQLDFDLERMLRTNDGQALQSLLPGAEQRVDGLVAASSTLQATARSSATAIRESRLLALTQDLDGEVERVAAWNQAYRELGGGRP